MSCFLDMYRDFCLINHALLELGMKNKELKMGAVRDLAVKRHTSK